MGVRLAIEAWESDGTRTEASLELDQPRIVLGRGSSSDVQLPHASVSAGHATLRASASGYTVVDERSTNGTRVGDVMLVPERPRALRTGDVLRIGPYAITITLGIPVAHASTSEDATTAAKRLVSVAPEDEGKALVVVNGPRAGERIELPGEGSWIVGRGDDADLRIDDSESSRRHAELVLDAGGVTVRDAGSKNGVVVNGKSAQKRRLRDGDELLVGATTLRYVDARDRLVSASAGAMEDAPQPPDVEPLPSEPEPRADERPVEPSALAGVELVEESSAADVAPAPARSPRHASANDGALADRFVFGLALLVLALSAAAIVWIFGGS